jgi:CRP-like cAMP-binding protein
MYTNYKNFMLRYISLNLIEWNISQSRLKVKEFYKGETILSQGDICKELHFINFGLARGYVIDEDGKDFTWSIFFNDKNAFMTNLFVTDYKSFLHQKPSDIHIEALEDTQVFSLSFDDVQFLYNRLKKGERFGRLMAQEAYSYLHGIVIDRQIKSAKERFFHYVTKDKKSLLLRTVCHCRRL